MEERWFLSGWWRNFKDDRPNVDRLAQEISSISRNAEGGTYVNGGWIASLLVHSLIRRVGSDSDL
jgi:hypothetical protein